MERLIILGSVPVRYELQIKNVKRINLRVHTDGRVCVSANRFVRQSQIDSFLQLNGDFILDAMERFRRMREAGDGMAIGRNRRYEDGDTVYLKGEACRLRILTGKKESVERIGGVLVLTQRDTEDVGRRTRMMNRFLKDRCREEIEQLCRDVYPVFEELGVAWPEIRIRSMTSRWGSCQPAKSVLTFAQQLAEVPETCAEYVVVHEFAHFIHPDHSAQFHDFLSERMPDWKERRNLLNSRAWVK